MVVSGGKRGGNMVVSGGQRGGNMVVSRGKRGGNMVVSGGQRGGNMVVGGGQRGSSIGSSNRGSGISTIDVGWVSLGLSITLGNDVSVVETSIWGSIVSRIGGQRGGTIAIGAQGEPTGSMSIWVSTIGSIGGDVLSISSGFRLGHSSGGKSENYKHLHGA